MTAQQRLDKIKKSVGEEVFILEFLIKLYPDLEVITNRWNKEYYCSSVVNEKAIDYHCWHSCGCCADAPLYCNPYIKHGSIYVYAKPLNINIGEKCPYEHSDRLYDNWKEILSNHNINDTIINKVAKEFGETDEEEVYFDETE